MASHRKGHSTSVSIWGRRHCPCMHSQNQNSNQSGSMRIFLCLKRFTNFHTAHEITCYTQTSGNWLQAHTYWPWSSNLRYKSSQSAQIHPPPTKIPPATPPPSSIHAAKLYPDARDWGLSHDPELKQVDSLEVIEWLTPALTVIQSI